MTNKKTKTKRTIQTISVIARSASDAACLRRSEAPASRGQAIQKKFQKCGNELYNFLLQKGLSMPGWTKRIPGNDNEIKALGGLANDTGY